MLVRYIYFPPHDDTGVTKDIEVADKLRTGDCFEIANWKLRVEEIYVSDGITTAVLTPDEDHPAHAISIRNSLVQEGWNLLL